MKLEIARLKSIGCFPECPVPIAAFLPVIYLTCANIQTTPVIIVVDNSARNTNTMIRAYTNSALGFTVLGLKLF